ncbi:GNAT family N-acetyltransferase [Micromonospora auratinigra]|uniref:L-amino acid N-acyltransferase YncA n=1 Tax=Micromonospora auratinigra TaxID=261654 RepID=A0A1A9A5N5_9ACTN|nr:GNAT family N-acetyltransferase [Micromonospora auratinigra]SBT51414.1 L-amino acid N-acyltransferase YncA [Micromonospora auratinigra]
MIIRPVIPEDLPEVARLCAAHARYEQAPPVPDNLGQLLAEALSAPEPRLWCLVAAEKDALVAYLTMTLEFSTWRCREYAHLDCLYVDESHRGLGLGRLLMDAAVRQAHALGAGELQWQTPAWNVDAIRFYDRLSATSSAKRRYNLQTRPPSHDQE